MNVYPGRIIHCVLEEVYSKLDIDIAQKQPPLLIPTYEKADWVIFYLFQQPGEGLPGFYRIFGE